MVNKAIVTHDKKYLSFSQFERLSFWDYYTLSGQAGISSKYELVPLEKVLTQRKEKITVDDSARYKRCRVQLYGNGIVLRDEVLGSEIKTKTQYLCKANDFLVAEIDAKFGGYGIVPQELDGAIVSSHYFVFEIDTQLLLPEYLSLVVKCESFSKQVKATGSTNYAAIRPYHVLKYQIPLPSLGGQKKIIAHYEKVISGVEYKEQEVKRIKQKIQELLAKELGIPTSQHRIRKKGLDTISFRYLDRWDIWEAPVVATSSRYPTVPLGHVVLGKPMYGANVKGVKKDSETRYIRITDINEDGDLNDDFVSPELVEERYLLNENDFLIARSGNTVGKTFLYKKEHGRAIYAGYLVKYNINTNVISPRYLLNYTKSDLYRKWIESNQRVSGQPNINGQEFMASPIILPPLPIQERITEAIDKLREEIKELSKELHNSAELAKEQIEKEIFGQ